MSPPFKSLPILAIQTDRRCLMPGVTLAQAVGACIVGGASLIIFAEHDLPSGPRATVARFVADSVGRRVLMVAFGTPVDGADIDGLLSEPGQGSVDGKGVRGTIISSESELEMDAMVDFGVMYSDWEHIGQFAAVVRDVVSKAEFPILVGIDPPDSAIHTLFEAGAAGIILSGHALNNEHPTEVCKAMLASFADVHRNTI